MKTSAIIIAAAAALASAQGTTCPKPNAAYCVGSDIIIHCDKNKVGIAGRCSANAAGYPPLDGLATCYQTRPDSGDAACMKNCVVYANSSFTLPASECSPSETASATAAPISPAPTTMSTADGHTNTATVINSHTNTHVGPTGTTGPTTGTTGPIVPSAGAATNGVAGALAVVGIVAAFFN